MAASEPEERPPDSLSGLGISKFYGAITALDNVSVHFRPGLNAIIGDNGAGKSTLMKIFSGVEQPDSGTIVVDGEEVELHSARSARELGIESLYQDLALAPSMSIADNFFLGRELVHGGLGVQILDKRRMKSIAQSGLDGIHINMPAPDVLVRTLSGGQRQAVAVARAVHFGAKILLLDEPTAALGPRETAAFFEVIKSVVDQGRTVIMVAHNLPQVLALADSMVVFRAGRVAGTFIPSETSLEEVTSFMVGTAREVGVVP